MDTLQAVVDKIRGMRVCWEIIQWNSCEVCSDNPADNVLIEAGSLIQGGSPIEAGGGGGASTSLSYYKPKACASAACQNTEKIKTLPFSCLCISSMTTCIGFLSTTSNTFCHWRACISTIVADHRTIRDKKAVLPQGNRAMPQVFFSVEVRQQHSLQV